MSAICVVVACLLPRSLFVCAPSKRDQNRNSVRAPVADSAAGSSSSPPAWACTTLRCGCTPTQRSSSRWRRSRTNGPFFSATTQQGGCGGRQLPGKAIDQSGHGWACLVIKQTRLYIRSKHVFQPIFLSSPPKCTTAIYIIQNHTHGPELAGAGYLRSNFCCM
eukprot:SAG22_NODE_1628_length_3953_cov_2.906591_1_plen_163_part_00